MATLLKKTVLDSYQPERAYSNPDISVVYELQLGEDLLKSGDKVLLKGDNRTQYTFRCIAHNIKLDSTWVDLCGPTGFRSVRVEMLKAIRIVKKRSRRAKVNEPVV